MAVTKRTRYVDTDNPALDVNCPRCGLRTARFTQYCLNCGYSLWPSIQTASAAFRAWKAADPARTGTRAFDVELPGPPPDSYDYVRHAHEMGIHMFPSSRFPFLIGLGLFLMAFAGIPFQPAIRGGLGVVGLVIFLVGVGGWLTVEDVRMFPAQMPHRPGPPESEP
ncbi:MAG: hypothetical protein ACREPA_05840 [Candidatus Dormibacteraceae bacterium]